MPSKLKKAILAVKDQTSISLAKVKTSTTKTITNSSSSSSSSVEVAILKATTHDEIPISDHQVQHILRLVSSNRHHASSAARSLGRRITRTRNHAVALKSLLLVLRLFQDGDPHFPKEVLSAMKRGYKILNLSTFSSSTASHSPWDFTAFVRTFALYLDDRLHCFLTGKLVHRTPSKLPLDMKPSMLLDRISHWQRLLDRAIGMRPTGAAKSNRLVQTCLFAVVQETFDLYRDVSDGLTLLLDSFFHLPHASCLCAYEACVKASRQFEELSGFYDACKSAGIGGRTSDYPTVMKMSEDLLDTLHDFLKDNNVVSSVPSSARGKGASHLLPAAAPSESGDKRRRGRGTSLEDLIGDVSWDTQYEVDYKSYHSDPGDDEAATAAAASYRLEDVTNDLASVMSDPISSNYSAPDFIEHDDIDYAGLGRRSRSGWELALMEAATHPSSTTNSEANNVNVGAFEVDFDGASLSTSSPHQYNPFLEVPMSNDRYHYVVQPTFRADLHDNGYNSSSVDLFGAEFGNGEFVETGGVIDLFADFDNGNLNSVNGSGSFHAKMGIADSQVISDASASTRLDEFARLSIM